MQQIESGTPINRTTTGTVSLVAGTLLGYYVNNKTAGATLVLRDGGASGTAITGTVTPLIGFHCMNTYMPNGCHATIAVQPMDITFFFAAG